MPHTLDTRMIQRLVLAVLLMVACSTGVASAQAPQPSLEASMQELRARAEQQFQVVTLKRGLVLVPKETQTSYANIEISDDGSVLIDGAAVTGRELRSRVGRDADVVAQISFLTSTQRRALFEPAKPPASVAPVAPVEPPAVAVPPEPPAPPAHSDDDTWVETDSRRHRGGRVRVGGDIEVREGETVGDAVVAVFGSVDVDGRVDGDVVAVGGQVQLGPHADVRGNVVAVGGQVERDPGAQVHGDINEVRIGFPNVGVGPLVRFRPWYGGWHWFSDGFSASASLFASLLRMAVIAIICLLFVAVAPVPVRRAAYVVDESPWLAALTGLSVQILFVPLLIITVVVLAISIVGIPLLLLVPFAILALLVAMVIGFAGACCSIGGWVTRRSSSGRLTLLATLVVGLVLVWGLTAIARFGGLAGGPVRTIMSAVLLAGFLVEYAVWTMGLGAAMLTRFGTRGVAAEDAAPAPDWTTPDGPAADGL
jgi:hypothetical protein